MNSPLYLAPCRQGGTYRPFTKAVLEQRYPGGINDYTTKVRVATRALVVDRLLLVDDAVVIIHAAAENPAFAPSKPRARGATSGGNQ